MLVSHAQMVSAASCVKRNPSVQKRRIAAQIFKQINIPILMRTQKRFQNKSLCCICWTSKELVQTLTCVCLSNIRFQSSANNDQNWTLRCPIKVHMSTKSTLKCVIYYLTMTLQSNISELKDRFRNKKRPSATKLNNAHIIKLRKKSVWM